MNHSLEIAYQYGWLCLCPKCLEEQPERRKYLLRARDELRKLSAQMETRLDRDDWGVSDVEEYPEDEVTRLLGQVGMDYSSAISEYMPEYGGRRQSIIVLLETRNGARN
jgi:hypothetical protein